MLNLPNGLNEGWQWFGAVWAWEYGDGRPLSKLINESNGVIPKPFVHAVGQIVAGERPRRLKAAVKSTIPPSEFGAVGGYALLAEELRDMLLKDALVPNSNKRGAKALAENTNMKPIDVIRQKERAAREMKLKLAAVFNVEVEVVERIKRECKTRIEKWPVV